MPRSYTLTLVSEYAIDQTETSEISRLLDECFPDTFDGRSYFKQLPHFRYLAYQDEKIVGQLGIDHRVINIEGKIVRIFGLIDLCVLPAYRRSGIASNLLHTAEMQARCAQVDFLVLMGDNDTIYKAHGFNRVSPAMTKWLAVENVESVSIIERDLSDFFLVKSLSTEEWPKGKIDMLGYLF